MKNRNRSIFIMFLQNVYITVLDQIDFFCQKESKNTYTVFTNGSQILDPRKNLSRKILREFTVKSYILSFAFLNRIQMNGGLQNLSWFSPNLCDTKNLTEPFCEWEVSNFWHSTMGARKNAWMLQVSFSWCICRLSTFFVPRTGSLEFASHRRYSPANSACY